MFLNVGPQHPGTHGVVRITVGSARRGDRRPACPTSATTTAARRRSAERQTWHTYIPYTDRVDYLAGVLNNLTYLLASRSSPASRCRSGRR